MKASDYLITEAKLAEALGVPRNVVKACRATVLEEGSDWAYDVGGTGAVRYSRLGVAHTLIHLGVDGQKIASLLPPPATVAEPEPPADPAPAPEAPAIPTPPTPAPTETTQPNMAEPEPPADPAPEEPAEPSDSAANEPAPTPDAAPAEAEAVLDLAAPAVVEITVRRTFALNRRIVAGTLADGTDCRVRVRSSEKLRPGMVLRCTHADEDLYELADGERLPRFPGKR